ncbi:MAG: hypothetical protein ACOYJ2_08785 [Rickettsiales bacterium]
MADAQTEPFVVVWAPKDREEQPELYDALKRLIEPEMLDKVKAIATKYGLPGFEFQLYEIEEPNSDMDGKLGIKICFAQNVLPPNGNTTVWKLLEEMKGLIPLPTALTVGDYHLSGERRLFHDSVHTKAHGLRKLLDSRPTQLIEVGG